MADPVLDDLAPKRRPQNASWRSNSIGEGVGAEGAPVPFESGAERAVQHWLSVNTRVADFKMYPLMIPVPTKDGSWDHTPDVLVFFADNRGQELWQIKSEHADAAAWAEGAAHQAVVAYCAEHGMTPRIVVPDIADPLQRNTAFLAAFKRPPKDADRHAEAWAKFRDPVSIRTAAALLQCPEAIIYHGIARGLLDCDFQTPLTLESQVLANGVRPEWRAWEAETLQYVPGVAGTPKVHPLARPTAARVPVPFPRPITIAPGTKILWTGQPATIEAVGPSGGITLCVSGRTLVVTREDLSTHARPDDGRVEPSATEPPVPTASVPHVSPPLLPKHEARLQERMQIVDPLLAREEATHSPAALARFRALYPQYWHGSLPAQTPLVAEIAEAHGISPRQVFRYLAVARAQGPDGLRPQTARPRGTGVLRVRARGDEVLLEIPTLLEIPQCAAMETAIRRYLSLQQPRPAHLYRSMTDDLRARGLPVPHQNTLRKVLAAIPADITDYYRLGQRAWSQDHGPRAGTFSDRVPQFPLHYVTVDHKLMDVIVRDEEDNTYRPWLTLGIDLFSRMPWGFHLGPESPSYQTVADCVLSGLFEQDRGLAGTREAWLCWGRPTILHTDNGVEFRGQQLQRVCRMLGIEHQFRPRRTPRYGGAIERFFGSMDTELVNALPGATARSAPARGAYDSVAHATLSLEDLYEIVYRWLVDVYPTRRHAGLPAATPTPRLMWTEGVKLLGGAPGAIWSVADRETLRIELLEEMQRKYRPNGLSLDSIRYAGAGLNDLIGHTCRVKRDPVDISHCFVFAEARGEWLRVPAVAPAEATRALSHMQWVAWQRARLAEGKARMAADADPEERRRTVGRQNKRTLARAARSRKARAAEPDASLPAPTWKDDLDRARRAVQEGAE